MLNLLLRSGFCSHICSIVAINADMAGDPAGKLTILPFSTTTW